MTRRRGWTAVGAGAGLLSLAGASLAFACSNLVPSAYVTASPAEGAAGSNTTVSTHNMGALADPSPNAYILWADASNNFIQDLAPAPLSDAAVGVTIPANATPGYYYLNVHRGNTRATPATFTVPCPASCVLPPPPVNYGKPDTTVYGNLGYTGPSGSSNGPSGSGSGGGGGGGGGPRQVPRQPRQGGASGGSAASVSGSAAAQPGIFGTSAAPASATLGVPIPGAIQPPAQGGNEPAATVLGDLWGAFDHGRTTSQAPSLVTATGTGPSAALIVGLLVVGLVALFAGFGVAEVRRVRATSTIS